MTPPHFSAKRVARRTLVLPCLVGVLCACNDEEPVQLPGDETVVAKVEEQPITDYDVARALDKSLGKFAVPSVERRAREKVVESLVQSRAMTILAERSLEPVQLMAVEREVASYRESLLVKHYLSQHAPVQAVTSEQIQAHYEKYPERYGARQERTYELIFGVKPLDGAARIRVMRKLTTMSASQNWSEAAQASTAEEKLGYATGSVGEKALHPKLKELLEGMSQGSTSNIVIVQGRAYVGRITGETQVKPRPLSEVRDEIEKALEPANLSRSIRQVGKDAAAKLKVERFSGKEMESSNVAP